MTREIAFVTPSFLSAACAASTIAVASIAARTVAVSRSTRPPKASLSLSHRFARRRMRSPFTATSIVPWSRMGEGVYIVGVVLAVLVLASCAEPPPDERMWTYVNDEGRTVLVDD